MTLEKTEMPPHIPPIQSQPEPVKCDYIDVSNEEGDQPRFRLQPHANGGNPIGPALILELEGAHGLIQHLGRFIPRDPIAD